MLESQASLGSSLDLFSTRQTNASSVQSCAKDFSIKTCVNNAPYFAIQRSEKSYVLWQGCCNSWNCPRCGEMRAKAEYGRIVEGCREIAKKHEIYFITLTCRGKEMSLAESEENYYKWTNRFLTACRTSAKRANQDWIYVQVTERQKRGHPHSHVLTTFKPKDLRIGTVDKWTTLSSGTRQLNKVEALRSDWLEKRCISAGLGNQYDISQVETVEGASRYVAKYLFKESMFETTWRKGWKRVRYSNSFPKLPKTKTDAIPLVKDADWHDLASKAIVISPTDDATEAHARFMLMNHDILIRKVRTK